MDSFWIDLFKNLETKPSQSYAMSNYCNEKTYLPFTMETQSKSVPFTMETRSKNSVPFTMETRSKKRKIDQIIDEETEKEKIRNLTNEIIEIVNKFYRRVYSGSKHLVMGNNNKKIKREENISYLMSEIYNLIHKNRKYSYIFCNYIIIIVEESSEYINNSTQYLNRLIEYSANSEHIDSAKIQLRIDQVYKKNLIHLSNMLFNALNGYSHDWLKDR
jgi:hypothetical protein